MSEQRREIRRALEGVVRQGDAFVVRGGDKGVEVETLESGAVSPLRTSHPEFYGYLATLNGRISAATGIYWGMFMLLMAVAGCVAVYLLFPNLRVWWVYVAVVAVAAGIWSNVDDLFERPIYEEFRTDLQMRCAREGLSRDRVVGLLVGDDECDRLIEHIRKDRELD